MFHTCTRHIHSIKGQQEQNRSKVSRRRTPLIATASEDEGRAHQPRNGGDLAQSAKDRRQSPGVIPLTALDINQGMPGLDFYPKEYNTWLLCVLDHRVPVVCYASNRRLLHLGTRPCHFNTHTE